MNKYYTHTTRPRSYERNARPTLNLTLVTLTRQELGALRCLVFVCSNQRNIVHTFVHDHYAQHDRAVANQTKPALHSFPVKCDRRQRRRPHDMTGPTRTARTQRRARVVPCATDTRTHARLARTHRTAELVHQTQKRRVKYLRFPPEITSVKRAFERSRAESKSMPFFRVRACVRSFQCVCKSFFIAQLL